MGDHEEYIVRLPKNVKQRRVIVLAGSEILAIRDPEEDFFRHKKVRCNMCGLCCLMETDERGFGTQIMEIGGKEQSVCGALRRDGDKYECHAGPKAPWGCTNECGHFKLHPDCVIEYE